jgi:hypothetical protein
MSTGLCASVSSINEREYNVENDDVRTLKFDSISIVVEED